jgi:hypothetical protein
MLGNGFGFFFLRSDSDTSSSTLLHGSDSNSFLFDLLARSSLFHVSASDLFFASDSVCFLRFRASFSLIWKLFVLLLTLVE